MSIIAIVDQNRQRKVLKCTACSDHDHSCVSVHNDGDAES